MCLPKSIIDRAGVCPACSRRKDFCGRYPNGLYVCGRSHICPPGYYTTGESKNGHMMFVADDPDADAARHRAGISAAERRIDASRSARKAKPTTAGTRGAGGSTAFDRIRADMRPMTDGERRALAERLTLPLGIFDLLGVQYLECDDHNQPAWVFPETDAAGVVVGYTLRYADGAKRNHGRRGLSLTPAWLSAGAGDGAIYLVEGASDTLAMLSMGLAAVGRPSNTGGVDHLVDLLTSIDPHRRIVVVGENDAKADGTWPGREGAEATAAKLAARLARPVYVVLPPVGVKDARELIQRAEAAIRAKETTLRQVGEEWGRWCESAAVVVSPPDRMDAADTTDIPDPFARTVTPLAASMIVVANLDFTAVDCVPRPDDSPPPVEKLKPCPNKILVWVKQPHEGKSRVIPVDCKKPDCEACNEKKRDRFRRSVDHHIRGLAEVAIFSVSYEEYDTVRRQLCVEGTNFMRLDRGDGTYDVVSEHAPAPKTALRVTGLQIVPGAVAADRFAAVIQNSFVLKKKMLLGSNPSRSDSKSLHKTGWNLLDDKPEAPAAVKKARAEERKAKTMIARHEAGEIVLTQAELDDARAKFARNKEFLDRTTWRLVGKLDFSWDTLMQILKHHGVKWRDVSVKGAGMGIEWKTDPEVDASIQSGGVLDIDYAFAKEGGEHGLAPPKLDMEAVW